MKRLITLIMTLILMVAASASADQRNAQNNNNRKTAVPAKTSGQKVNQSKQMKSTQEHVLINLKRPSSGGQNRNFPSQQPQHPSKQQTVSKPSYGKLQLAPNNQIKQQGRQNSGKPPLAMSHEAGPNTAVVVHHHPYEPNYVRQKLKKLGVVSAPGYIVSREEVIHTDRAHSVIAYPKVGFDNRPLNATAYSSRHLNDNIIRTQMSLVDSIEWHNRILGFNQAETQVNHYYWHNANNFNYCHFIDNLGYHWYGWYLGNKYFWIRNFSNRWWWYDADYDHWCFWNNGFWWWQDPYHIGDLYCYNNANYIPCNSAEDNVAVVVPDDSNTRSFTSPDKTRIVKVVADTQDAFLYDTANPPAFNPIYLASGVQDVIFSDPNNGRPLEIILKLNDQSFDMFDGNGNPYNPGTSD
jgi:hypothetical protein